MFKKLLTDALIKVLRMLGLKKVKYPSKLWHKTRSEFIENLRKTTSKK